VEMGGGKVHKTPAKELPKKPPTTDASLANWHIGVGAATQALSNEQPLQIKKMETATESNGQDNACEIEHVHLGGDDVLFSSLEWQSLAEFSWQSVFLRNSFRMKMKHAGLS